MSLEAGSSAVPRPPPRPTLPTARHVSLILSTTPAISAGQRLNVTEWPTRPEVASAPYRPGQGTAGITGHCVPTLCHDQRLGQGMTGVTGHCVLPLCPRSAARSRPRHCTPRPRHCTSGPRQCWGLRLPRPPHRSTSLGPDQVSASCIVRPQRLTVAATSTPRHSWGSHDAQDLMGRPHRPSTPRMGHSDDHAATGTGHRAWTCRPCRHDAA